MAPVDTAPWRSVNARTGVDEFVRAPIPLAEGSDVVLSNRSSSNIGSVQGIVARQDKNNNQSNGSSATATKSPDPTTTAAAKPTGDAQTSSSSSKEDKPTETTQQATTTSKAVDPTTTGNSSTPSATSGNQNQGSNNSGNGSSGNGNNGSSSGQQSGNQNSGGSSNSGKDSNSQSSSGNSDGSSNSGSGNSKASSGTSSEKGTSGGASGGSEQNGSQASSQAGAKATPSPTQESTAFSDVVSTGAHTSFSAVTITSGSSTFTSSSAIVTSGTFTSQVPIATTTITANNLGAAAGSSKKNVGAIVGGTLGALFGLALLCSLFAVWKRKRNHINAKFTRVIPGTQSGQSSRAASWADNTSSVERAETPSMMQVDAPQIPASVVLHNTYSYDHGIGSNEPVQYFSYSRSPSPQDLQQHSRSSSRESIHPDSLTPGTRHSRSSSISPQDNYAGFGIGAHEPPLVNPFDDQDPFNGEDQENRDVVSRSPSPPSPSANVATPAATPIRGKTVHVPRKSSPLKNSIDVSHDQADAAEFKKVDL